MVSLSLSYCFSDFRVHLDGGSLRQRGTLSFQQHHDQHWHLRCQWQPTTFLPGKLQPHHPGKRRDQYAGLIKKEDEKEEEGMGESEGGALGIGVDIKRGIKKGK